MLAATVIPPPDREHFSCGKCGVDYDQGDYEILLSNKKIAYFRLEEEDSPQTPKEGIPAECICHECLYKTLLSAGNGEALKIKMIYFDKMSYGVVEPDDDIGFWLD